jgi:hypothetical protein
VVGEGQAAGVCHIRSFGPAPSRLLDAQVAADLANERVWDLGMPGNSGTPISDRVAPPGMASSLADKYATVPLEMADQIGPFHGLRLTSS